MPRYLTAILTVVTALFMTGGLALFAIRNYQAAAPIAEENLRGLALTTARMMEGVGVNDTSLQSLGSFLTTEVAYAALLAADGKIIFHTNPDLIGSLVADNRYLAVSETGTLTERRVQLGTGESVYEFQTPLHLAAKTCILRLALHTWRADEVMRQARLGLTVVFTLLAVGWALGLNVLWLLRRQARQQRLATRHHELMRLGEVGAVLAHEVRNPLAGIKGYAQFLEERLPEGKERGFASLIVGEAKRLEGLTDDILLYTRSEALAVLPCRPAVVAASVLELLAPQVSEHQAQIRFDIPPELVVLCPEEGLRRVLLNLITNALQASPRGGGVVVSGRREGQWVTISVADNGPGIAPEMLKVLFEPFRTSKARGAGLGLAVCKKIIEGCGGSIEAGVAPAGGALFVLRLAVASRDGD